MWIIIKTYQLNYCVQDTASLYKWLIINYCKLNIKESIVYSIRAFTWYAKIAEDLKYG